MQMRPQIQIKSVIKALAEVVLPAVDPQNKLAQEQARLAIGTLTLMAQQLPLQAQFDLDELSRLIKFSHDLRNCARGGTATQGALAQLAMSSESAAAALESKGLLPQQVEQWIRTLRAESGALIKQLFVDGDPASRVEMRAVVLAMSKEQLLRDRSWLLMQGWEPDPKSIPPIAELLGLASS